MLPGIGVEDVGFLLHILFLLGDARSASEVLLSQVVRPSVCHVDVSWT